MRTTTTRRTRPAVGRILTAVLLLATAAHATPVGSPADPAFGPAPVTVDFESAAIGIYPAYAGGLTVPTPAGDVNFLGARLAVSGTYAGQYNTTGARYLSSEGYLFRNVIMTFPAPVHAVGMHVGLTSHPWNLIAYDAAGAPIETVTVPPTLGSNAGDFFGIASATPIAQVVLVVQLPLPAGPLWIVVDDVRFDGTAVDLVVQRSGHGDGAVTSAPAGIDCGTTCRAAFGPGTPVTLTAAPAAGSFFGGWSGDCSGVDPVTVVTPVAGTACTATFHALAESADLRVVAEPTRQRATAGRRIGWRITTANRGPATAAATSLTIVLDGVPPADVATLDLPRACVADGATVTCALGDLRRQQRRTVSVSVVPTVPGTVRLTATAGSAAPDPTPADAMAAVDTVIR